VATVFPQAIGMAATWDPDLVFREADAISTEARAKHHETLRQGKHGRYQGLTFWSPNINIFRDPRWGRGQETYGEDPFLTSRIGVAFVKGLQGNDPKYLKLVATPKHFAVHSGPEKLRHGFDAKCPERDLHETYLPAFRATVGEAHAQSVMSAYNAFRGIPCSASDFLLGQTLRRDLGFGGFVVSDCGAIRDIFKGHHFAKSMPEAAALGVKAGCDLCCGTQYASLPEAVEQGLVTEQQIDVSLKRLMKARFQLGMFDPPERVPYAKIPYSANDTEEHRRLAAEVARKSMVLLKNDGLLPLGKDIRTLAVVGPYAEDLDVLLGNYNGKPSKPVTFLKGLQSAADRRKIQLVHAKGCHPLRKGKDDPKLLAEAVETVRKADAAVVVVGISPRLEGEQMRIKIPGFDGGDRTSLDLPARYETLLEAVAATGKPVVLVLTCGSALSVNWAAAHVPAILVAWYPGEEGGTALADILFGDANPSGRLPVTFYRSVKDLPPFTDYSMKNRTYRFFRGEVLYPFGHGLSYTTFQYKKLSLAAASIAPDGKTTVRVEIQNSGKRDGEEVVQIYVRNPADRDGPLLSLKAFRRVSLKSGQSKTLSIPIAASDLAIHHPDTQQLSTDPGTYEILVGASSKDIRAKTTLRITK
jgi:beta-glucosidase